MLHKVLLTTTALVLCVALEGAGPRTVRIGDRTALPDRKPALFSILDHYIPATVAMPGKKTGPAHNNVPHYETNATFNNFSRDANAQFISWYGYSDFRQYSASYSCSSESICTYLAYANNAIPITGTGTTVTRIKVPLFSLTGAKTMYNVGIYSATPSGLPGSELAGASTTARYNYDCCKTVRTVDVNVTLNAGQKYFVEVTCATSETYCSGGWNMEDTDLSGNAQDYYHYKEILVVYNYSFGTTRTYSYSSPWHVSTKYPEQPAAIVR